MFFVFCLPGTGFYGKRCRRLFYVNLYCQLANIKCVFEKYKIFTINVYFELYIYGEGR